MANITEADAFLEARNKVSWAALDTEEKTGLLTEAEDYLLAAYTFTVAEPQTEIAFKAASYYLAYELSKTPLAVSRTNQVQSKEERLEGVVTNKVSYAVGSNNDPYPLITQLLKSITAQTGGFRVVTLAK